ARVAHPEPAGEEPRPPAARAAQPERAAEHDSRPRRSQGHGARHGSANATPRPSTRRAHDVDAAATLDTPRAVADIPAARAPGSTMRRRLLDLLLCPRCRSPFSLEVFHEEETPATAVRSVACATVCAFSGRNPRRDVTAADCTACYTRDVLEGALTCTGCGA